MAIPGTIPITAPVASTSVGDTFPSHLEEYAEGTYRSVADNTERDAIPTLRRKEGMLVKVLSSGIIYTLEANLTTWTATNIGVSSTDVMLKSDYDPNDDQVVLDSDNLEGENGAFYLDRTNHTGTDEISDVNGLQTALDAKEDLTNKGAANGYVPLNASSLIDAIYLPISSPIDPVLAWDVITNTPTLADGGLFTAGNAYIVTVSGNPTPRDLGSGSEDWSDGDLAIYTSGNVFIRVPNVGVGVANITTDAGTFSGAVTIDDTSHLAPSTDRNYVTDDQLDALDNANSPSASNPVATMSDLTGIIVVGNGVFLPELFSDSQTLGDGTSRTLASLGYNNTTAGNYWTRVDSAYTIDVNTMTIDWIAWQEAMLAMEQDGYQSITTPGGRGYVFNQTIALPKDQTAIAAGRRSLQWMFDFNLSKLKGNNFIIFDKYPADQTEANGLRLDYSYHFLNGTFEGGGTANATDCAIRLGGTTHSSMTNIKAASFGVSFDWEFCLETTWKNIKLENYGLYGLRLGNGTWSGAGLNNAQSNIADFNLIRCVSGSGKTPTAGLYFNGNQNITTNLAAFEGFNGSTHHVLYDNMTSTTTKYLLKMNNSYFEAAGASRAMIRVRSNSGTVIIDGWSAQGSAVNLPIFIEAEGIGMPSQAPMFVKLMNAPAFNLGYKFRQLQVHKWTVEDVTLNNNTSLLNAANWDTVMAGSSIPAPTMVRYTSVL